MKSKPFGISKCPCGSLACKYYFIESPNTEFVQGTGFIGRPLAQRVANFLNAYGDEDKDFEQFLIKVVAKHHGATPPEMAKAIIKELNEPEHGL